ncbi:MAG: hypothetical protein PHD31_02790 [Candidatus Pacebacteria bacterium]|nr:hypothetical protein [Candidatus Paceibacterota bacterium]
MGQVITLNGTTIKNPTEFHIENYKLTRETGRLINGDMTMDYVALKKKFILNYESITGTNLKTIMDILDTSTMFFTLTYKDNEGTQTKTVYAGAIPQLQYRTDGVWLYKDVELSRIVK